MSKFDSLRVAADNVREKVGTAIETKTGKVVAVVALMGVMATAAYVGFRDASPMGLQHNRVRTRAYT